MGLRGVGKTTWGRKLARRLGWPFIDTDEEILKFFPNKRIGQVHESLGEEKFRRFEDQIFDSLSKIPEKIVIAPGGGALLTEKRRKFFQELGTVLCLKLDKEKLRRRWDLLPMYQPKLNSFDEWFDGRSELLAKMEGIEIDVEQQNWIDEIMELMYVK